MSATWSGTNTAVAPVRQCAATVRDRGGEVVLGRHVVDRVVHHDRVERAAEPHRAHVAHDVLALGVERPRDLEHLLRQVDEREREALLEVPGVVPAPAAELEQVVRVGRQERPQELGLLGVVLRRRDQRPPRREVGVEAVARAGIHGCDAMRAAPVVDRGFQRTEATAPLPSGATAARTSGDVGRECAAGRMPRRAARRSVIPCRRAARDPSERAPGLGPWWPDLAVGTVLACGDGVRLRPHPGHGRRARPRRPRVRADRGRGARARRSPVATRSRCSRS